MRVTIHRFKYLAVSLVILLAKLSGCGEPVSEADVNIVLIVADDLGWKDTGFMGSAYYETPNLDRLASEGMHFTNAYAAAANCAPSRACLMSGQNTPRHGVYTVGSSARGKSIHRQLIPVVNSDSLDDRFITLAEELKASGYTNITLGKWHLGENPKSQGFDYNVGGNTWGHPKSYFAPFQRPDLEAPEGTCLTDLITDEANQFIKAHTNEKFFLYLPYYAVHSPLQGKEHLVEKYTEKGGQGCQGNPKYAAMVENLDSCIGTIMENLKRSDIEEHTLVIFTSDNGGIRKVSCQDPLRAGKGSYYEGGIRVPLIVKWPGHIRGGAVSDVPVVNMDFYPTILDIVGKTPENERLDGVSILPLLTESGTINPRPLYWHFPIYLQAYSKGYDDGRDPLFRTRPGTVVRFGDWKLHYYYEDAGVELYTLREDPGERNNLAEVYPDTAKFLLDMLHTWIGETGAEIPSELNPEWVPVD